MGDIYTMAQGLMDLYGYTREDAYELLEIDALFDYQKQELAEYLR